MAFDLGAHIPDRKWIAGGIPGVGTAAILVIAARYQVEIPLWMYPFIPVGIDKIISYITWPSAQDIIKRINGDLAAAAGYMPTATPQAEALRAVTIAPSLPLKPVDAAIVAEARATQPAQITQALGREGSS